MNEDKKLLTEEEIDAIGEILNISMGAAATAVSTMLERQVLITTPEINQSRFGEVDFSALEPAIIVKIKYIKGLSGTNILVFRRRDMGTILDLLMGNHFSETDEYEFDEMSMSAAGEVMNQMMGSSATAMSEMLHKGINISTPQAVLVDDSKETQLVLDDIEKEENVVAVSFKMTIKETLDTTFSCILPLGLSRDIVRSVNGEISDPPAERAPQQPPRQDPPKTVQPPQPPQPQPVPPRPVTPPEPPYQPPAGPAANPYPYPPSYQQPFDPAYAYPQYQQPVPQQPYGPSNAGPYPYGPNQYPEQPQNARYVMPSLNVKQAEFPGFSMGGAAAMPGFPSNMNMLMGVQLEVSVVIGRAKQKIKDVLEFGQGTVIELDKQTGSPAEIVVNGQLIAHGDVVVVGDNFGIRVTDIVGTEKLMDSLGKTNK